MEGNGFKCKSPEMIATHKLFQTYWTTKVFLSGVGACVASQLIASGKSLATVVPLTRKWFFA